MTRAACCRAGREPSPGAGPRMVRFALLGQPNTGRTTLFNRLCGVRARTANYPGTTCEVRLGRCASARGVQLADLPGTYGLDLDLPESRICRAYLEHGMEGGRDAPGAVLVVIDASNLARSLAAAGDVLGRGLPVVVALNKIDLARRRGLRIDVERLGRALGLPVVAVSARGGENLEALAEALASPVVLRQEPPAPPPDPAQWAARVADSCLGPAPAPRQNESLTDRLDALFTHPLSGLLVFAGVMTALFTAIFSLAELPMNLIELFFGWLGSWLQGVLPAGPLRSLASEGIVAGLAGTIVFLPQIFLLFFLIGLLEDSGYLARAAFVAERILRRFGLPGHAFVPLLSAHACAIPAIMSARLVPDPRDRLATILVAPFMSCSARLPVYVLLIGLLFPGPIAAGLAFSGCYALGAVAAVLVAALLRRTVVGGQARPLVLELPDYQWPSLRNAALTACDRALVFLRNAATVIMAICVLSWWLSAYPLPDPGDPRPALAQSYMGRLGRAVQPAFEPLGFDWQLSAGVVSSFAAREVFVSTMAVMCGAQGSPGSPGGPADAGDAGDAGDTRLLERIRSARRDDGAPVFTTSSAAALLVFYVLAMQCLPTLAVTRREAGGWRWAALQLVLMSGLAYGAAFALRRTLILLGVP